MGTGNIFPSAFNISLVETMETFIFLRTAHAPEHGAGWRQRKDDVNDRSVVLLGTHIPAVVLCTAQRVRI